ncbi:MAG: DUF4907 domain-containing protein [Ginsengibacter sp.]
MKSKIIFSFVCMLLFNLLICTQTSAQERGTLGSGSPLQRPVLNKRLPNDYTFRVFLAPNKTYGYDIINQSRVVFHQPAFSRIPGDPVNVITRKEEANIAAMLTIEKIKRGIDPELSKQELQKITGR